MISAPTSITSRRGIRNMLLLGAVVLCFMANDMFLFGETDADAAEVGPRRLSEVVSSPGRVRWVPPPKKTPRSNQSLSEPIYECERILVFRQEEPAIYCPLAYNMGLTNIMTTYARCILAAWRYADAVDVYLPLELQLGTIHDLFDVAALRREVHRVLGVTLHVGCTPSDARRLQLRTVEFARLNDTSAR
eukprot:PhM_4_TR17475/c0_g1_i1/m.33074